jgi:hypothetical protein
MLVVLIHFNFFQGTEHEINENLPSLSSHFIKGRKKGLKLVKEKTISSLVLSSSSPCHQCIVSKEDSKYIFHFNVVYKNILNIFCYHLILL